VPGRRLLLDTDPITHRYRDEGTAQRRRILRETIAAFEAADPPDRYHRLAAANLQRWRGANHREVARLETHVLPGDWGDVAQGMTRTYGECFAVLNMANAYSPGGAYVEGAIAQEENMFRRTDCHFRIGDDEYDAAIDEYRPHMTELLEARTGVVYLDTENPRVCIRGPEDRSRADLGYAWLDDDDVFPFFELRAAAVDLRDGSAYDPAEMRRRIAAQLDTLRGRGIRHAVLGAFGCGAFENPAQRVAAIYREELAARADDFSVVAFAVFHAGYGRDNYTPFAAAFA
jgi:hypothetical protein